MTHIQIATTIGERRSWRVRVAAEDVCESPSDFDMETPEIQAMLRSACSPLSADDMEMVDLDQLFAR